MERKLQHCTRKQQESSKDINDQYDDESMQSISYCSNGALFKSQYDVFSHLAPVGGFCITINQRNISGVHSFLARLKKSSVLIPYTLHSRLQIHNYHSEVKILHYFFNYAVIVFFRKNCYCGDNPPKAESKENAENCNIPCSGDDTYKCGGESKINLFSTSIKGKKRK